MTRIEKKVAGVCVRPGCAADCSEDNDLCPDHAEEHRELNRRWRLRVSLGAPRRKYRRREAAPPVG